VGFLKNVRNELAALHERRAAQVIDYCSYSDLLADTGSARAESVPGIPKPVGNQDFGGFIVVTSSRMIYKDYRRTLVITFDKVKSLSTYSHPLHMTTGLNVEFYDGEILQFSGNTPFIKKFVKEYNRGNIPLPGADFSDPSKYASEIRESLDEYFSDTMPRSSEKKSKPKQVKKQPSRDSKTQGAPKYRSLTALSWISVKNAWIDENLIYEDPAWLISWDNKEVDLLPKNGMRSFQQCLDNAIDQDFFSIVSTGSKRRSIPCEPGFILLALPGKSEFQATLTSKSPANLNMASKF
jgi:hypothetical protein